MSAVVPPPPPSGSILQKQSSFSRSKAGTTTAAAATSANRAPASTPSAKAPPAPTPNSMAKQPAPLPSGGHPAPTPNRVAPPAQPGPAATPGRPAAPRQPLPPPDAMAGKGKAPMPPGMWGPNGQVAPQPNAAHPPAMSPASGAKRAMPPPPANQPMGNVPASSPASGAKRAAGNGVAATPKSNPAAAAGAKHPAGPGAAPAGPNGAAAPAATPSMVRQNSMNGGLGANPYGSMGAGGPMAGYGSMGANGPMGGYGSMGGAGGPMGGYGSMGPGGPMGGYGSMGGGGMPSAGNMGSMYGDNQGSLYGQNPGAAGSMMGGPMGGSMYGQNGPDGAAAGGSMYGQNPDANGSLYGQNPGAGSMMGGMNSMYGVGGPFGSMGPGSMMNGGSMMGPMGSMYGMGGGMGSMYGMGGGMSTYGIAAQWGSLANMSAARGGPTNRSGISSGYGGFAEEATTMDPDDLCPNIGTFEDAKDLKRSGKRGGNHLYSRDKHEKIVATGNSNAQALTIKRKADIKGAANDGAASTTPSTSASPAAEPSARVIARSTPALNGAGGKARAKVPSNYNVHTLVVVDKASGAAAVTVKDPATVVYEKAGKKETFEVDEALERATEKDEVDSVLLSELRSNWFNGHNSALMMCAGKGKAAAAQEVARGFVQKCIDRLEKNEKDTGVKFDITMTMVAIRGADQCCDLLKDGAGYDKMVMGSSPVYGPCLLDLEAKVVKTSAEASKHFSAGLKRAKEEKEIVTAFFVLKTIKKTGAEVEVHLSSLCVALCGETASHVTDIKDKAASSPHRLFRYAIDGACVTVSGLCTNSNDEEARGALEVERKVREVKNDPPRSGNVKRFVDFTYKAITQQKEKAAAASGGEKRAREAQIERMEEMVKDANELLAEPEKTMPKGYGTGR